MAAEHSPTDWIRLCILSQYSRRQCRRLLLASLVAMVYTVWWLLLIPTVVVYMYYWVYRRRGGARWRHASLYDRRSRRRCRRRPAQRAPFPPPPPLFRFCVWPTRRIETGGRCDSILDGTVALLAFAGMVVSSWLTLSTSNSASIQAEKTKLRPASQTAERAALSAL